MTINFLRYSLTRLACRPDQAVSEDESNRPAPEDGAKRNKNRRRSGGEKLQSVRVGLEPGDFWREPSEKVKRQSRTISPVFLAGEGAAQLGFSPENSLFSLPSEI